MPMTQFEPEEPADPQTGLPPSAKLEMARIEASANSNRTMARVQGIAVMVVGVVVVAIITASSLLSIRDKPLPEFYGAVVSIAITGLVSVLSYNAGKNAGGHK